MSLIKSGSTITSKGENYMRILVRHWGSRFKVSQDGNQAVFDFGDGTEFSLTAHPDHLNLKIKVDDAGNFDQMKSIFEEHVQRFAKTEKLKFSWE